MNVAHILLAPAVVEKLRIDLVQRVRHEVFQLNVTDVLLNTFHCLPISHSSAFGDVSFFFDADCVLCVIRKGDPGIRKRLLLNAFLEYRSLLLCVLSVPAFALAAVILDG